MGVRNLKYVDSIILEWEKNNLRTLDEIHEYDRRFKERQLQSARYRSAKVSSIEEDKREKNKKEENRNKALIKELYMS